jgi:hypothetical protein
MIVLSDEDIKGFTTQGIPTASTPFAFLGSSGVAILLAVLNLILWMLNPELLSYSS